MPYADPKEQKEAMRRRYRERYENERGFRQAESRRKAAYYAENPKYRKKILAAAKARRAA